MTQVAEPGTSSREVFRNGPLGPASASVNLQSASSFSDDFDSPEARQKETDDEKYGTLRARTYIVRKDSDDSGDSIYGSVFFTDPKEQQEQLPGSVNPEKKTSITLNTMSRA
jgi:hypothetical protein